MLAANARGVTAARNRTHLKTDCGGIDITTMAHQIVLAARPHGKPKLSDFRLEETAIPTPNSGQVLLGVQYLSLDPYMRGRMDDRKSSTKPLQLGHVMTGETVVG
jgi:NADPH-dependent curcumin reductase